MLSRRLVLRREALAELANDDLRAVAGAGDKSLLCTLAVGCVYLPQPTPPCPPLPSVDGPAC